MTYQSEVFPLSSKTKYHFVRSEFDYVVTSDMVVQTYVAEVPAVMVRRAGSFRGPSSTYSGGGGLGGSVMVSRRSSSVSPASRASSVVQFHRHAAALSPSPSPAAAAADLLLLASAPAVTPPAHVSVLPPPPPAHVAVGPSVAELQVCIQAYLTNVWRLALAVMN